MYSYTFDSETGGIILNSTPTNFSKEPRPVYAAELDILGFDKYWDYDKQNDVPYMWAESNIYWYKGRQIAKTKGGDLYTAPELQPTRDENGSVPFGKVDSDKLEQMDLATLQEFGAWLESEGLQAIATRVSTGGECSVIISDGYAEGGDTTEESAAVRKKGWKKGVF